MHKLFRWSGVWLAIWLSFSAQATFYVVTGTTDNTDSATHGGAGTSLNPFQMSSLRGAITAANASAGADTIFLPAGTYTLTIAGHREQANVKGDLDVLDDLTITGSGGNAAGDPALTVIQGGAGWDDKIIDVNPNNNLLLNFTLQAVTITGGNNTDTVDYYGGGINMFGRPNLTGAGAAGTLTLDNCVITGNTTLHGINEGGGGLLAEQVNATINNCVFSNNSTGDDYGGGISSPGINENFTMTGCTVSGNHAGTGFNGGGLALRRLAFGAHPVGGTISITGSTFANNSAGGRGGGVSLSVSSGALAVGLSFTMSGCTLHDNEAGDTSFGSGPAEGGAFYYSGDTSPNAATVVLTKNNIFNNSLDSGNADRRGGGGIAIGSGGATVSFSRLAGNTIGTVTAGNQGTGLHKDVNDGTVVLTDNWWGSNSGPTGSGNTAVLSSGSSGAITFGPYLILDADPASATGSIGVGDALNANFFTDSAAGSVSAGNLTALNGVAITFNNPVFGAISGASSSLSGGAASATFTPNGAGYGHADVTVDGVTVTANISIPTTVASITSDAASPSGASSVSWTVTFADVVSTVTAGNFNLVNTGLGGAPGITSVAPVGVAPAVAWTVTASTGSGSGTLQLKMVNDTGISAPVSNLPFDGSTYTLDLVPPDTSITGQPPAFSGSASATFTFTGTDTGTGVASFEASLDGGAFVASTSPVNLSALAAGSHTFQVRAVDQVGNVDPTPASYNWTIDLTNPGISLGSPDAALTSAGPVHYTVTYTDANFDQSTLSTGDITLNHTGTATGTVSVDATTGASRTITISGITGDGTLGVTLAANTAHDLAGNPAPAIGPSGTFTVDNTAPTVTSINRLNPAAASTTGLAVTYRVTFSENVSGADISDFTVTATGTAAGTLSGVTGSGTTYDVTVNSLTGSGTVRLDLKASGTGIQDGAGNAIATGFTSGQTYTIAPSGDIAAVQSTAGSLAAAGADSTFGWSFTVGGTSIQVTRLGFFDESGDGLAQAHDVGLWDNSGTLIASVTVQAGTASSLVNGYRYEEITPVTLAAGQTYTMGAFYLNASGDRMLEIGAET